MRCWWLTGYNKDGKEVLSYHAFYRYGEIKEFQFMEQLKHPKVKFVIEEGRI